MPVEANAIIRDVFENLISNAIKYAPDRKLTVIDWKVSVIDFGPGIEDEVKDRIFERFKRENKRGVRGSGLGLAISKRVVELHEGDIWVEDTPGGGATFVVELPKP